MMDPTTVIAAAALVGLIAVTAALLFGWHGWLRFKYRELERGGSPMREGSPEGAARIELAALKERIRKLEAIASGVDL